MIYASTVAPVAVFQSLHRFRTFSNLQNILRPSGNGVLKIHYSRSSSRETKSTAIAAHFMQYPSERAPGGTAVPKKLAGARNYEACPLCTHHICQAPKKTQGGHPNILEASQASRQARLPR